ncbi:MAG TPA: alkaline phosphatase family protein, partial [Polyangiaceae bacterium]|nr:alkaline phosphatase family protein [Polyangiaceae bacterium]
MNPSARPALLTLRPIQSAAAGLSVACAVLASGCEQASSSANEGYRRAQPSATKLSPLGTHCPPPSPPVEPDRGDGAEALARINHFVILYMENHSFDSLYGLFPGADGLLDASCALTTPRQVDKFGVEYPMLDAVPSAPPGMAENLPNQPFLMDARFPPNVPPPDLNHSFYGQQAQLNGGAMNQFAAFSDARGLTVAYYDTAKLPLAKLAEKYTLCDRFFQSAFGGSFLNHQWLIAARTPYAPTLVDPNREPDLNDISKPFPVDGATGIFTGADPAITSDGFAV